MKFQREVTAAVLIPAVLAVLVFAPTWAFTLLVAAASVVALIEFYALLEVADALLECRRSNRLLRVWQCDHLLPVND